MKPSAFEYLTPDTTAEAPAALAEYGDEATILGPERIVFGSDHPYVPIEATAGGLRGLELDESTLEAIGAGNALRLLQDQAA